MTWMTDRRAAASEDGSAAVLEDPAEVVTDRLLTVPNAITFVRLLCIPLFLNLLFVSDARLEAALLLGLLGATDWVDGYAARHLHQVSNFGKAFDPTVDRLLLITGVTSIIIAEGCPLWFGLVVVAREVVLSTFVVSIMALGAKRMDCVPRLDGLRNLRRASDVLRARRLVCGHPGADLQLHRVLRVLPRRDAGVAGGSSGP